MMTDDGWCLWMVAGSYWWSIANHASPMLVNDGLYLPDTRAWWAMISVVVDKFGNDLVISRGWFLVMADIGYRLVVWAWFLMLQHKLTMLLAGTFLRCRYLWLVSGVGYLLHSRIRSRLRTFTNWRCFGRNSWWKVKPGLQLQVSEVETRPRGIFRWGGEMKGSG